MAPCYTCVRRMLSMCACSNQEVTKNSKSRVFELKRRISIVSSPSTTNIQHHRGRGWRNNNWWKMLNLRGSTLLLPFSPPSYSRRGSLHCWLALLLLSLARGGFMNCCESSSNETPPGGHNRLELLSQCPFPCVVMSRPPFPQKNG